MAMSDERAVASAIIRLMQGVVYKESDEDTWLVLERHAAPVRDHFAAIGVDVVVADADGYAYLRSRPDDEDDEPLPRLVRRRSLTYNASLLLVLAAACWSAAFLAAFTLIVGCARALAARKRQAAAPGR